MNIPRCRENIGLIYTQYLTSLIYQLHSNILKFSGGFYADNNSAANSAIGAG